MKTHIATVQPLSHSGKMTKNLMTVAAQPQPIYYDMENMSIEQMPIKDKRLAANLASTSTFLPFLGVLCIFIRFDPRNRTLEGRL